MGAGAAQAGAVPRRAGSPGEWRAESRAILVEFLGEWERRHGALPAPCPGDLEAAADWWCEHQEPRRVRGAGYESAAEYAGRCRSALRAWLALEAPLRAAVVAGIEADGVAYRGESFAAYQAAVDAALTRRGAGQGAAVLGELLKGLRG